MEFKEQIEQVREATLTALNATREEWKKHYEELKADGAKHSEVVEKIERALKRLDTVEALVNQPVAHGNAYSDMTLGQTVVAADGLKEFLGRMKAADGKAGYSRGMSYTVPFQSLFTADDVKTTITTTAVGSSTPGILVPQRVPGIVKPGVRRNRVRDLMPRFPTTMSAVEFVKENVFTNAASPQAEASSKAESALTFTIDYSNVRTIAHWIPATKQILDDFTQLQAYIDMRLLEGLKDKEDSELLTGDGLGDHLSGLTLEATAYDTARTAVGDTYIDKLNHAISQVEDVNLTATGIVLHPRDWRAIQLTKDQASNVGNYIMGGPKGNADEMLWGLPVATSTAVTVGKFFVGAFATHTAIWDRMDARVDVSTEHSDYFIKNMVAIRAEERLAFTVYRSDAVVYGSF
jgi:HK97 family phage major capsid protein